MVNGYRMNCTVSIGEGTNCAYLYLLKEPVAVDIYNDASGAVYTAGESYSMALDPSLAGLGSSVSVYALTSDSSEPFGGIQASISPGQDAILLNIAQDCASGFYSIRLNSEWEGKYVFTDCLIYVTDLVFYSDDSGAPAGEITPSLPFDRDREYNLTLGDINGPYDAEDLQSVQVSSTTLMTISGNGAHFTMKPTGESGSEELIVQATLKDGSVRRGILSLRASATLPVMLLSSPDLQAPVSFAVAQPREFVFYLDGYSAAEQNERVRLKDVQVIDAANLTIEPDFEAGTATVTSTRGSVYASATLQVVYEVYDFISNSWNERTGSFSLRGFSSPKAHLNTVLVDLDSMQPLYSLVMEKGAVYRVQAAWRDSSSGSESYHTWPEDADFSFVLQRGGSIINVPNSFRQETLGMDVYFDVKPIDGVVRGYELTCKQVPVSLENGLEWNYSLKIDAGPLYSAYLSASLYKPSPTTDNPIYVDGVENRSSSTAVFGKIPTEITSGIAAERIGSGEKPIREGIKELTATSSNPDLVSVNGPLLTVDQTAYYFECTTDVTSVGEAEILVTVTYDNGIVRQMNALIAMYESTNQYTSLEVSPELLKEKNMTLQQFIDSSELPPSLGSMQTALYLAEGEYEGDLVLKKPLQVHGTASYDEGLQAWVAGSTIKGSIRAESGSYLSNLHIVGTNEPSTVGVSGPRNTYVTIYTCLIEGFEIGVDSCFMNSCVVCGCTVGCLDSPFTNSTLKNNDIGARVTIPYLAPNRNRFINNGLHIQNTASYPLLAEQNYFRMDTETDVKEFPYAACFEGNVDVEPYYEDYEMTHLSVVPDEPSGEIELKPENNEVVINITNPTSSQVSSEIFEKAKQSAAAENEEEKVETLTFEVKSSEGETNVKWEFKTSELTNTSISPSLSVKLDFDQLLPEEGNLTEQEQTAKEDIADILEQVAEQGGQSVKYQSISFVHQGDLPGPATVTIQKNAALTDANNLKLYYYNPETSSLELYDDVVIIDNGDSIRISCRYVPA